MQVKRVALIVLGILVGLSALGGALFGAFLWRFTPDFPDADYPEPASALEARLQDIDYLRRFPGADLSFSDEQRTEFAALVDDLEARAETMSEAEFVMGVSAAGAIPENGHTGVSLTGTMNRLNSLPVRFVWFGDGLFITRAHAEHEALIGARVFAYEGQAPEEIADAMDPYFVRRETTRFCVRAPRRFSPHPPRSTPRALSISLIRSRLSWSGRMARHSR